MYRRGTTFKKFSVKIALLFSLILLFTRLSLAAEFGAISNKTAGDSYEAGLKNSGLPVNTKSVAPTPGDIALRRLVTAKFFRGLDEYLMSVGVAFDHPGI